MKCKITHEEYMKMSQENEKEIEKAGHDFEEAMNKLLVVMKKFRKAIKKLRRRRGNPTWLSG